MKKSQSRRMTYIVLSLMLAGLLPGYAFAGGMGNHSHDKGHHSKGAGHHKHDKWETPPEDYAKLKINRWADSAATMRGKVIYDKNCLSCHGADGEGSGPLAKNLPHPPADLTNHFHNKPGDGDGYLFWRISEGGLVEPFKSMQSAMPAYKSSLNEGQRWDVLVYVHNKFHGGFSGAPRKKEDHGSHGQHGH